MSKIFGMKRLSANAKKVSANAKFSLATTFTLHASIFLSTFVAKKL